MSVKTVKDAIRLAIADVCRPTMSPADAQKVRKAATQTATGSSSPVDTKEAAAIMRALDEAVLHDPAELNPCTDLPKDSFFIAERDFNMLASLGYNGSKIGNKLLAIDGVTTVGLGRQKIIVNLDPDHEDLDGLRDEIRAEVKAAIPGWEDRIEFRYTRFHPPGG
jgi:hypothetical protein